MQPSKGYNAGNAFYITLQGNDTAEIKAQWDGLANGAASILIPLAPAPFAPLYTMLTDRYGLTWIVGVGSPQQLTPLTPPIEGGVPAGRSPGQPRRGAVSCHLGQEVVQSAEGTIPPGPRRCLLILGERALREF